VNYRFSRQPAIALYNQRLLFLAGWTVKTRPTADDCFVYRVVAGGAFPSGTPVYLEVHLKISALLADIDEITDGGATAVDGVVQNCAEFFYQQFPLNEGKRAGFSGRVNSGHEQAFVGIDITYACNDPVGHYK
jgi:hypothetical protein